MRHGHVDLPTTKDQSKLLFLRPRFKKTSLKFKTYFFFRYNFAFDVHEI